MQEPHFLSSQTSPSQLTWALRVVYVALNVGLTIAAVTILGYRDGQGLWIFGTAWFPIILFLTIEIVTVGRLPSKPFPMLLVLLSPFFYLGVAGMIDQTSVADFVMHSAALIFTAAMVAFALQAAVFPVIYKTRPDWSTFINEEVIPQAFGFGIGLVVGIWMIAHLVSSGSLSTVGLLLMTAGILQNGYTVGIALHRGRN